MTLDACINRAVEGGEMDPERAREAIGLYAELEAQYRGRMGQAEAAAAAGRATVEAMARQAALRRRQMALSAARARAIEVARQQAIAEEGSAAIGRMPARLIEKVELREKAVLGRLHARFEAGLHHFRRRIGGAVRNRADLDRAVDEIFGVDTGNAAAKAIAKAWSEAAEFARRKFNAAGGNIPKRADWGLPQSHDSLKVRRATFDEWRAFILPRLDQSKMIDELTGQPFTPERLELALKAAYETIRTDGWIDVRPSAAGGRTSLANRRTDPRFFVFRDPQAWREYHEAYGAGDIFGAMVGHLDGMARDIAALEILGPNPEATLRWFEQLTRRDAALADAADATDRWSQAAEGGIHTMREMWGLYTGKSLVPGNGRLAHTLAGLRNILTSAQLGSTALAAITSDIGFQRIASRMAGLPMRRVVRRILGLLPPGTEGQRAAVRLGLVAEGWTALAISQVRYIGEVIGPELSRRVADAVMRISLLSPWTQAGRWAFGMEFFGQLADVAGRRFGDLDPALRRTMRRYGIDADAWDIIRATDPYRHDGAAFLRPDDVAARADIDPALADDLATRLLEMVLGEREFAVPSSSLRARAALVGSAKPGTFTGEILRSAAQYKNFPLTLLYTHIRRAMGQPTLGGRTRMLADLMITLTIAGAVTLQAREIAKGRDPRPMDDPAFWGAAVLQGGGLSLFGDFLFSTLNRYDRGLAETIMGPTASFAGDTINLTVGNVVQAVQGEETNLSRELVRYVRDYTPGGSTWYLRLAYERLILDQLLKWSDPRARTRFAQQERRWRREFGQDFWWRPGETAPRRPPDLGAAVGAD